MSRQAIHYKSSERQASLQDLRKGPHFHYCVERECRLIYEDNCKDVRVNGRCHLHRGSRRPIWIAARDPQACCIGNCAIVGEVKRLVHYRLAGPGPWYQCSICARAHGWNCA